MVFHKKNRSFTIIELLVVVAISGLLASIIVVSLQSAKDKARIAKALQFSATIKHSLGTDIVGEWRLEEGIGSSVADSSGNNNNGTPPTYGWKGTGPTHWEPNSIHELGWAGKFNGTNDFILIPDSNSLRFLDQITIEAWIKTNNITISWMVVSKQSAYLLWFSSGRPIFYVYSTIPSSLWCSTNPFVSGQWHHYVGTYDGSKMKIIVDGKEICSQSFSGKITSIPINPLRIGTYTGSGSWFDGNIDEVRIYERGLSMSEIQKHYAEGAAKRGLLVKE